MWWVDHHDLDGLVPVRDCVRGETRAMNAEGM